MSWVHLHPLFLYLLKAEKHKDFCFFFPSTDLGTQTGINSIGRAHETRRAAPLPQDSHTHFHMNLKDFSLTSKDYTSVSAHFITNHSCYALMQAISRVRLFRLGLKMCLECFPTFQALLFVHSVHAETWNWYDRHTTKATEVIVFIHLFT